MADISKIRDLKNERTYNIADAQARSDLNNKVSKNGDTMFGDLVISESTAPHLYFERKDRGLGDTISGYEAFHTITIRDKNNNGVGAISTIYGSAKDNRIRICGYNQVNGNSVVNYLDLGILADGSPFIDMNNKTAWRSVLGLGNTTGPVPIANGGTSATTAANALTNLGAMPTRPSSIEFFPHSANAGHGGILDFHYNQSSSDYTARIMEGANYLGIYGKKLALDAGPLDIQYGGTGATTTTNALTNLGALPTSGGTINGNLTISRTGAPTLLFKNNNLGLGDTVLTYTDFHWLVFHDKNSHNVSYLENIYDSGKHNRLRLCGNNYVNGSSISNYLDLGVYNNGNAFISVSHPIAWRSALGVVKSAGDTALYVATTGNDTTGNGTSSAPFKTISKAVEVAPYISSVIINIAAGTYTESSYIYIDNKHISFVGTGNITIKNTTNYVFEIVKGSIVVFNGNITIEAPSDKNAIIIRDSHLMNVGGNMILKGNIGINAQRGAQVDFVARVDVATSNTAFYAIQGARIGFEANIYGTTSTAFLVSEGTITCVSAYYNTLTYTTLSTLQHGGRLIS